MDGRTYGYETHIIKSTLRSRPNKKTLIFVRFINMIRTIELESLQVLLYCSFNLLLDTVNSDI